MKLVLSLLLLLLIAPITVTTDAKDVINELSADEAENQIDEQETTDGESNEDRELVRIPFPVHAWNTTTRTMVTHSYISYC